MTEWNSADLACATMRTRVLGRAFAQREEALPLRRRLTERTPARVSRELISARQQPPALRLDDQVNEAFINDLDIRDPTACFMAVNEDLRFVERALPSNRLPYEAPKQIRTLLQSPGDR
jgi:hypothetical protein